MPRLRSKPPVRCLVRAAPSLPITFRYDRDAHKGTAAYWVCINSSSRALGIHPTEYCPSVRPAVCATTCGWRAAQVGPGEKNTVVFRMRVDCKWKEGMGGEILNDKGATRSRHARLRCRSSF